MIMQPPADEAEPLSGDGEKQGFATIHSILKDVKKLKHLSLFIENELTDDALDCISTEKEMRDVLKDVKIPVGVSLHFSKKWFDNKILANKETDVSTESKLKNEPVTKGNHGISRNEKEPETKYRENQEDTSKTMALEKNVFLHGEDKLCETKDILSAHGERKQATDCEVTKPPSTDINANTHDVLTVERPIPIEKKKSNFQDEMFEKTTNPIPEKSPIPDPSLNSNQPQVGITDSPGKSTSKQKGKLSASEKTPDDAIKTTDISEEVTKPTCSRKPFGKEAECFQYTKGSIFMLEENREIEFKALTNETPEKLPWKIMEKARLFICGILNAGGEGTIYFGIGDSYDTTNNFIRGEIVGLEVEGLKDEINKAFQSTLDDHIKSDDGMMNKGGDMNCVKIYFVSVEESGERTGRYVIEIEVKRDWKFCKDNVYYVRAWNAKRGTTLKYGLHDLYKVTKEKWEDPEIRTCGKTDTVKNVETDKQIKEPLSQKYQEWLLQDDASRKQLKRMSSYDAGKTIDIQKFSTDVLESLRELKYKENDYILIANKVPPEHRDSTNLAFLQSIPWLAVFDLFDPNSKKDGLHFILNETSDSARATVKELGDFKSLTHASDDELSTRGTTWIFRSQSMHESDWTRNSKDCLYRAISAYSEQSPTGRIHCVFFGLSEEFLQEMADIIDSCFSIIGNNANKNITILSEHKDIGSGIVKFLKADVRKDVKPPCSIFGFPLDLLRDSVKGMLGPIYYEPGATTDLPYMNGKPRPVMNKRLNSLTDLEVYVPKPKLENSLKAIIKAKENFYMGDVIKQLNLFHRHDIERTRADELTSCIEKCLKRLSDPSEVTRHVNTISLSYESGSGATTLCRRILWNKKNTYRCAVVKTISSNTDYQIDELQRFSYETSPSFIPPVLVLVDNFPEQQVNHLVDKMSERKTKCVLLQTIPIARLTEVTDDDVAVLGQLDNTEIERVKRVLVEVDGKDNGRREAAAKVLEREKRFIWLGLELFGRQYIDIKPRLSKHIHDIISHNLSDKLKDAYEMILHFCCLLDIYSAGRSIYPHPCAVDILYSRGGLEVDDINKIDKIHNKFGGLLLQDVSESGGYLGWRPAHFLVGEVVGKEMDLLATAKNLVLVMNTGSSYAKKYLTSDTVNVFLKREKKSDSTSEHSNEPDFVLYSSVEDADMFGSLEVRTRYSALVIDIMSSKQLEVQSDVTSALDLLITLTENVTTTQHKARTWQQMARVFAYEIGMKTISKEDPLVARINQLVCPGRDPSESLKNGFEVAHLVIDQAIKLQESYVHHLVTKGTLFMAELRDLREEQKHRSVFSQDLKEFIQRVVSTSKKGIDVYDEALKKTAPDGYLHAMVGKITTVIVLLEILKRLPFFAQHNDGPDESFKNYICSFGDLPEDLEATLNQHDLEYFISVRRMVVQLLNDFFQEIKLRRAWSYNACIDQELTNAKIRALKLRERFYQLTGLDRLQFPLDTGYEEDIANQLLFQHGETPYGRWEKLPSSIVTKIYESLRKVIPKKTTSHDAMLMCARAALQEKVAIDELSEHVELWCQKFPRSLWANFFSYMIHFPVPNGSLRANVPIVKSSVAVCKSRIPYSKKNYRKSAAEYLLGKGVGLHAILCPNEVSTDSMDMKTKFWRSKDVFERLERLCGQKILGRKGVLAYKGIDILFDNDRYPKESRDDLWFCLGFTISGPYAYDPMEEDGYKNLKKDLSKPSANERDHCQLTTSSSEETRVKKTLKSCDSEAAEPRSLHKLFSNSIAPNLSATSKARNANQKNLSSTSLSRPKKSSVPHVSKPFKNTNKTEGLWKDNPKLAIRRRSTEGHQTTFIPKWIDDEGRVHHGASVKRAKKSSECRTHTTDAFPETCSFAHSRKGDTLQFVCQLCTKHELMYCNKKDEHSRHIYNLGAYFNEQADKWRS